MVLTRDRIALQVLYSVSVLNIIYEGPEGTSPRGGALLAVEECLQPLYLLLWFLPGAQALCFSSGVQKEEASTPFTFHPRREQPSAATDSLSDGCSTHCLPILKGQSLLSLPKCSSSF